MQKGGRVSMPSEYFGGDSGRYFEAGSSQLETPTGVVAVSQGTMGIDSMGPNLPVYNGVDAPTGIQTGGRSRKTHKKVKKSKSRKSKKSMRK